MVPVRFSDQTDRALLETLAHIAQDDPVAAMGLIEDLQRRAVETLGTFPDAGVRWHGGRRVLAVKRYALVYHHDAAKGEVVVLDVFGPGMDWR